MLVGTRLLPGWWIRSARYLQKTRTLVNSKYGRSLAGRPAGGLPWPLPRRLAGDRDVGTVVVRAGDRACLIALVRSPDGHESHQRSTGSEPAVPRSTRGDAQSRDGVRSLGRRDDGEPFVRQPARSSLIDPA